MSELLKAFYLYYSVWLDDGATNMEPFSRNSGLCWNFMGTDLHPEFNVDRRNTLYSELSQQFEAAGLNINFPFNQDSLYSDEVYSGTCHLNPKRIAWVRNQVEKIKEQQS